MQIREKMGLVYTALFLTVSVAVITQNADRLMAAFRGESAALAVDDIYTVQAGRDQRLFVLRNDVQPQSVTTSGIRLLKGPQCGAVKQVGGSFVYGDSASCTGHQSFTYCLDTGRACAPAIVALRLIEARDPIDSVLNGPITDLAGFDAQLDINTRDLEITNVHLGRFSANDSTTLATPASKLSKAAISVDPGFVRPSALVKTASVEGVFALPDIATKWSDNKNIADRREAALDAGALSDETPLPHQNDISLPLWPDVASTTKLPDLARTGFTLRAAKLDTGFQVPSVMPGLDTSPFGTPCGVSLNAIVAEGALVRLKISAPCHPNSTVNIQHGKLWITMKTDHIGNLTTLVPALDTTARIRVGIAGVAPMDTTVSVPDLQAIDRVVVQWQGKFDVDLLPSEPDHRVNVLPLTARADPKDVASALRRGAGFLLRVGDNTDGNSRSAEVYSLPRHPANRPGVIGFSIRISATSASCGQPAIIQNFRARGGHLVGASGLQLKIPACGSKTQSIVLKNAVRDLIIAEK